MIEAKRLTVVSGKDHLLNTVTFCVPDAHHLIITGELGSGKSILAKVLAHRIFAKGSLKIELQKNKSISFVAQMSQMKNKNNLAGGYYQQRFNSFDSQDSKTVEEVLQLLNVDKKRIDYYLNKFDASHILQKPLVQLSSGEYKKFQLVNALLNEPGLLILDEPYIGLDNISRKNLNDLLSLIANEGVQLVIVTGSHVDVPDFFDYIIELKNGEQAYFGERDKYIIDIREKTSFHLPKDITFCKVKNDFEYAVRMKNINVHYGGNHIIKDFNWEIKKNEKWLLTGKNGSGKSTLLSLIYADNPQAYSNEIYLFDRKRGTGESIWDIKKNIGFVSPELNIYFDKSITCYDTIASGFFDTMGLFKKLDKMQKEKIEKWIKILELNDIYNKTLSMVSDGKQRMILLARAMVKNPPMLILDEPCQALDTIQTKKINQIIDELSLKSALTMVYVSHYENQIPSCITHKLILQK